MVPIPPEADGRGRGALSEMGIDPGTRQRGADVTAIRILLLEDSAPDAEIVAARLAGAGLDPAIDRVETREAFAAALGATSYDLILAEYSLPPSDGTSALEIAREMRPQVPFLFVSGGLGEEAAIDSLKRGATDYILKDRMDRLAPAVVRGPGRVARAGRPPPRRGGAAAERGAPPPDPGERQGLRHLHARPPGGRLVVEPGRRAGPGLLGGGDPRPALRRDLHPRGRRAGEPGAEIAEAATGGRSEDERWHVRKDGTRFWAGGAVHPLLDEDGALRGYVKVMHDMTKRKRAEEALREADRRKDDFLAMLAHELRNPLSAINNAIQLARRSVKVEHQEWAKDVIGQQVKHLARLIDDLLDVSRITRGKIQLRVASHDAAAIVRDAVEVVRPAFEARRQRLSVAIAPGPLRVEADATRLEQVFANLLTNAAKYTEAGGIASRPRGVDIAAPRHGIGIAEMLPDLRPFVQAEQAIDRSQGGLGVGLTLARRLVEMHGGTLTAASAGRGLGSEFTARLPLSGAAAPPPDGGDPRAEGDGPHGPRVLIVDDNVESAKCLATLLRMVGYDAQTAFDGRSALEAALIDRPEIVLLDIGLPGMDGYELASALRRDRRLEDALLIAITGYGQDEDRRRSAEAGFNHHLVKPVDVDALLDLLAKPEPSARAGPGRPEVRRAGPPEVRRRQGGFLLHGAVRSPAAQGATTERGPPYLTRGAGRPVAARAPAAMAAAPCSCQKQNISACSRSSRPASSPSPRLQRLDDRPVRLGDLDQVERHLRQADPGPDLQHQASPRPAAAPRCPPPRRSADGRPCCAPRRRRGRGRRAASRIASSSSRIGPTSSFSDRRPPPRRHLLEHPADLPPLAHLALGDQADPRPPVRLRLDQPQRLQLPQRLADRPLAGPELARDLQLHQPVPRLVIPLDDPLHQGPADLRTHAVAADFHFHRCLRNISSIP